MPSYGSFRQSKARASTASEAQPRAPLSSYFIYILEPAQHIYPQHHVRSTHRLLLRETAASEGQNPLQSKLLGRCVTMCVLPNSDVHAGLTPQRSPKRLYVELANAVHLHRWKMGSQARREETTIASIRRSITPSPSLSQDIPTTTSSAIIETPYK